MADIETEFVYQLIKPIKYAHKGEQQEASFITFSAPSSRNLKECAFLKQCFYRALPKDTGDTKESEGSEEISGEAILALMYMSPEVDIDKVFLTASKLFISPNIALIEGQTQLKQSHVDNLSYEDLEEVTGKYLANFILASSLKKLKKK